MRIDMLGEFRVVLGSADVAVTSARGRTLLAVLALNVTKVVPAERLTEAIWGDRPPKDVRNQLQLCVSRLRRRLADAGDAIVTDPGGYRLELDPGYVDLWEFRRLVAEARAAHGAGRQDAARDRYRAGLGLWRGPALAGIDSDLVRRAATVIEEERLQAYEECMEVELAVGSPAELVPELTELVREHPYRESVHGALMRALYGAGRQADALAVYRQLREQLSDELGTEPGPELQRLHRSILNRDPTLAASSSPASHKPRQVPAVATCFVGREAELARLGSVLLPSDRVARHRPTVVVLYGPGGAGKSAMAVRIAHDIAAEFPDGQLYVDLLGSTPGMQPLPAAEALGRCLRSLGVHPPEIPASEVEAAALFRSVTADQRLLLVLDNAADRSQVTWLVPSAPACAVLVTCRQPIPSLDVDDRLRVGPLPDVKALELLAGLTRGRITTPDAVSAIVTYSDGLPLAIRIAAGRLAGRPDLSDNEYATRLANRSRRLDELQVDDLAVRASIRVGYDALPSGDGMGEVAAQAFRALGLLHVPDVVPGVVAAMLGMPDVEAARAALDRLVDAQLLESSSGGRYRLHDLVRLVATELATNEDDPATLDRAINYYGAAFWRAETKLRLDHSWPFPPRPLLNGVPLPHFDRSIQAHSWLEEELACLTAALEQAAARGVAAGLMRWLSSALWTRLDTRCEWQTAHRMSKSVLQSAELHADPELIACGLLLHGRSEANLGDYGLATTYLERALGAWRDLGNDLGVALTLNALGIVDTRRAFHAAALSRFVAALNLVGYNGAGFDLAAVILGNMCVSYTVLGELDRAVAVGEESLAISVAHDLPPCRPVMINLAATHVVRGHLSTAIRCADDGVTFNERAGDWFNVSHALLVRSEANRRLERLNDAATDVERALSLAEARGYRFAVAAAHNLQATIHADMGRHQDAARVRACADATSAQLTHVHRDILIDLLINQDHSSSAHAS